MAAPHNRILCVDDEACVRSTASAVLESGGYEVITARDGMEGLDYLEAAVPDVIISDLSMPRMSGFEFLQVVRTRFPHIPVIAISGEYAGSHMPNGILADAFFEKGQYTIPQLFERIRELLRAAPIRPPAAPQSAAPLWVAKDGSGKALVTCPKCLRSLEIRLAGLNGGIHQVVCDSCGRSVRFVIDERLENIIQK
jgi:CheY-like chemotaxis protein